MPNRLANERSPYLAQHSSNPVDWYPWGPAAFEAAKVADKPIYLSIGYSTCHWCHVMERESFSDAATAVVLNESFICVKVDREERPDVDRIYMAFVQATTGQGGWPMNVFLTPDLHPIFGTTYIPAQDAPPHHQGFLSICKDFASKWGTDKVEMKAQANEITDEDMEKAQELRSQAQSMDAEGQTEAAVGVITEAIQCHPTSGSLYAVRAAMLLKLGKVLSAIKDCDEAIHCSPNAARPYKVRGKARAKLERWEEAALDLAKANQIDYDDDTYEQLKHLQTEKVPQAIEQRKLLEHQQQIGITEAKATHCLHMLMYTLHCISQGGICDHVGGGFSRYSVDEFWHVPHFEKMLYDNAQLVSAYCTAFLVDRRPLYERCIVDTLEYVRRELTHPEGGFYSAQDADSLATPDAPSTTEGAYYVWSADEIGELIKSLHPRAKEVLMPSFGVREEGNVHPVCDPRGELKGKNVLFLEKTTEQVAHETGVPADEIAELATKCKALLFQARQKRPKPHLDDKVVTSWNGLMISAYAKAFQVLRKEEYLAAARKAITFIRNKLYDDKNTQLLRCWRDGPSTIPAFHSDYACFIQGLLDTYGCVGNPMMLKWADQLQTKVEALFGVKEGAYFDSTEDPHLVVRMKEDHDGAEPAANSITAMNVWRLGHLLQRAELLERGKHCILGLKRQITNHPRATSQLLAALDLYSQSCIIVAVTGDPLAPDTHLLLQPVLLRLVVRVVVVYYDPAQPLFKEVPYLQGLASQDGKPTAHVFESWTHKGEATTPAALEELLMTFGVV
eukprot:NODE_268_length_2530_cov_93.970037_g149_i1.p1 GENE.NODE_268_length_2530_cov_93.970037_g149_i1~~NODE_268_length_2530_cov_93.970037_g149_i1.p1  ORF type:complete len:789 (-),score=231.23 NODE_268_length_2530_cov_93.970037_g149_i1:108-2474(-)